MSFARFQKSKKARRWVQIVMIGMGLIFVIGAFWSFGSPMSAGCGPKNVVAFTVNDSVVHETDLWMAVENYRRYAGGGPEMHFGTLYSAVSGLARDRIVEQECKRIGVTVSPQELDAKRTEYTEGRIKAAGEGTARSRFLVEQDSTWEEYLTKVKHDARGSLGSFRAQIREDKLRDALTEDVAVSDDELLAQYRKFTVRHILVKVPEEAEKEQWLEANPEAPESAESGAESGSESAPASPAKPKWFDRADDDARALAESLRQRVTDGGEDFAAVAKEVSDDAGSAVDGGSLGELDWSGLQGMVPEFRDAVVALEPGAVSEPVKSQFGYHIIKVEKRVDGEIPPDFASTKEEKRDTALNAKKSRVYGERLQEMVEAAHLEFRDKEAEIAWVMGNRQGKRLAAENRAAQDRALTLLGELIEQKQKEYAAVAREGAVQEGLAPFYYEMGAIYEDRKQWADALAAFQSALGLNPVWQVQLEVARCLVELERADEAVSLLKDVSEATPGARFQRVHQDLFTLYSRMGKNDLAQAELQVLMEAQQSNPYGNMGGLGGMPLDVQ